MKEPIPTADRSPVPAQAAATLPVLPPLAALVEIVVLYAILVLGDWLHPGIELSDIRPHPFWIPVLLLSLQYGTVSGMVAAAVAIGLTVLAGFPEQGASETYFSYLLKIWIEPILWIGAAVLIGQLRMRQLDRKQELLLQVQELSSQRAAIADYARNLRNHCSALERQLAGRSDGNPLLVLKAMHEAFEDGTTHGGRHIEAAFETLVGAALPAVRATLYVAASGGLRLACVVGKARRDVEHAPIDSNDALYLAIVGAAAPVSVLTREGERQLAGRGLAAVPILSLPAGSGTPRHVLGMLKLEEASPGMLDDALLPAMAAIGGALAPALQAQTTGAPLAAPAVADGTSILTPSQKLWRHLRLFRGRQSGAVVAPEDHKASTVAR